MTAAEDLVADALVDAVSQARWPDGSLLVDLHPDVTRERLAPHLTDAFARQQSQQKR